jgi:hypothetical protein
MGCDRYCVLAMRTSLGSWLPNVPAGLFDGCQEESDLWLGLLHSEHDSPDVWIASRFRPFAFFRQSKPAPFESQRHFAHHSPASGFDRLADGESRRAMSMRAAGMLEAPTVPVSKREEIEPVRTPYGLSARTVYRGQSSSAA